METEHLTIDRLLAEVQRHGKVETRGGQLVLTGRFPRDLIDQLRPRQDEALRALALPRQGSLLDTLADAPGVPRLTVTMIETEDTAGDVAILKRLVALFEAHPGANRVVLSIHQLDGTRKRVQWRACATTTLRRAVAVLLRERAEALGFMVHKGTGRCRRCDGNDLAYEPTMRLFCRPCRLAGWRENDQEKGARA